MSATTTQLLSSGEFCRLLYDTIPVKSASANVSFYTYNSKVPNLSCDTLVANERYIRSLEERVNFSVATQQAVCASRKSAVASFAEVCVDKRYMNRRPSHAEHASLIRKTVHMSIQVR